MWIVDEILTLIKYREFIKIKVKRIVAVRYRRSILGFMWTMLNPLLMMLILTAVFSVLLRAQMPDVPYSAFALTGILVFNFFSEATNGGAQSIISHAELLKKVYIPKLSLPIIFVIAALVNFLFSLIPLFAIYAYTGVMPGVYSFLSVVAFLELILFTTGVSLILAPVAVFVRDIMYVYSLLLTALFYATPVFYPASIIPEKYKFILWFNPLYYMIEGFRVPLLLNTPAPADFYIIGGAVGLISLFVGLFLFAKMENYLLPYL